jgi:SGNH hydrolase-like domain, acetyltransferase AlgX
LPEVIIRHFCISSSDIHGKNKIVKPSRYTLARVLPYLMLMIVVTELMLHFLPVRTFTNRASEALGYLYPLAGPFEANAEYHNARSYGDLPVLGNLPARRLYRRVDFVTDSLGFHNSPSVVTVPLAGILFGDSFAIGAEVPPDKTLSVQLSRLFPGPIYNAGAYYPLNIERVHQLASRLRLEKGVFIYEFHEAHFKELPAYGFGLHPSWRHRVAVRLLGPLGTLRVKGVLFWMSELRLKFLAQKLVRLIENDGYLPNSLAGTVIEGQLQNGDWMLFLRSRTEPVAAPEDAVKRWADFFSRLSPELSRDGLQLVVIIVPDSTTVYGPLLASPAIPPTGEVLLSRLEELLRGEGIPVVNVTAAFRAAASQLAERRQYLYWRDDTHWNVCGVTIAVTEFQAQLSSLLQLPGRSSQDSNWDSQPNCEGLQIAQHSKF